MTTTTPLSPPASSADDRASADEPLLPFRTRDDLIVRRLPAQRQTTWAVKDPLSLRYYQLRAEEYFVLRSLDGKATVNSVLENFRRQFAPARLSPAGLQAFIAQLVAQGLVVSDLPGQGVRLWQTDRQYGRRVKTASVLNPLVIRFRGIDPDRWLTANLPLVRWLFSPAVVLGSVLLIVAALLLVAVQFDEVLRKLPSLESLLTAEGLLVLLATLGVVKVLHELGHAFTCKYFGGDCHELGPMLLAFVPCLYCNVSDAWLLTGKWQRIAVSAAGIWVELTLAAIATFLWWFSEPGLFHTLCLHVMLIGSMNTLLLNGNPLLRYDGYYVLSDLVEVPNLRQQATDVLADMFTGRLLGAGTAGPLVAKRDRWLLALYGVAAAIYLWFVIFAILWFVYRALEPHGFGIVAVILAIVVLIGRITEELRRLVRFLVLLRKRGLAVMSRALWRLAALGGVVVFFVLIPWPRTVTVPAMLRPQEGGHVYVTEPGRLVWSERAGTWVESGAPIARLENLELEAEIVELKGQRDLRQMQLENVQRRDFDPQLAARIATLREALADAQQRLDRRIADREQLTLRSPRTGYLHEPAHLQTGAQAPRALAAENTGRWLAAGELLAIVGDPQRFEAVLTIPQRHIESVALEQRVQLQLPQVPGSLLEGALDRLYAVEIEDLPVPLLVSDDIPLVIGADGKPRPEETLYRATVALEGPPARMLLGSTGHAAIEVGSESLLARLRRWAGQTFHFRL